MAEPGDRQCDILVVSSSDKMNNFISRVLPENIYGAVEIRGSASVARRELLSRRYDVVIVNIPLADETATDLAIDISNTYDSAVILISPADRGDDIAERVTEHGIAVLSKPINTLSLVRSVKLMSSIRDRYIKAERKTQSLEDKMAEIRIVNRAKWILIERDQITEDEAHRKIGKMAMDRGVSRRVIAEEIVG